MKKIWLLLLLASIFLTACSEETPAAKVTDPQQPIAVNAGEAQVTLGYYPPSNNPVDPQQTTTFTVIVK